MVWTDDCTSLDIDEETSNLLMTRPAFGGNIMATKVNPTIGRKMKACLLDDKWFIKIEEENGDLVTMFPKEKFRTLEQILRYMTNSGYTQ